MSFPIACVVTGNNEPPILHSSTALYVFGHLTLQNRLSCTEDVSYSQSFTLIKLVTDVH